MRKREEEDKKERKDELLNTSRYFAQARVVRGGGDVGRGEELRKHDGLGTRASQQQRKGIDEAVWHVA